MLLSCLLHRAETRFNGASTCQAPVDPEFGQSCSRAHAHGHLTWCMRFRGGTAVLGERGTAQTWDVQAGSLGDIYQGLEGERTGAKLAGTRQSQGGGVVWSTGWKVRCSNSWMETVLEAVLKGGNRVKVNRRKGRYGESPLSSLLWECLQLGRSSRQRTGWFFSRKAHQPQKKHQWALPCWGLLVHNPPQSYDIAPNQLFRASPLNGNRHPGSASIWKKQGPKQRKQRWYRKQKITFQNHCN